MASAIIRGISAAIFVVCALFVSYAHAHGRLIEPPSRSSMWRFGFNTPKNYDDNQLFCGGFNHQWGQNQGRCGVCGDPYDGARENEAGGKYATGTIVRRYQEGQTITVTLDITKNHGGYFEFRVCPNDDPSHRVTEACLNSNLLRQPDGQTKWYFTSQANTQFSLDLVLPRGLTCTQCVMQWKWNSASNWGCEAGQCGKGLGHQEQFYGCADVSITSTSYGGNQGKVAQQHATGLDNTHISNVKQTLIGSNIGFGFNIKQPAIGANTDYGSNAAKPASGGNGIPNVNALGSGGNSFIPIGAVGTDEIKCEAVPAWKARYIFANQWCLTQCATGNCPSQYCQDGCRKKYGLL